MNKQRMQLAGLVGLFAMGAVTVTLSITSLTAGPTQRAEEAWTIERVLPVSDDAASFHSRFKRRPCTDQPPAPDPSSIAAESGLFLLSHPVPAMSVGDAPEVLQQMI